MKNFFATLCAALGLFSASANNIAVSNARLRSQNTTLHTTKVNFNITWENGWRTSTNESNADGAWVFVKYRKTSTNDWRHATLTATNAVLPAAASMSVPSDGKGAFLYRSANGTGTTAFTDVQIEWNYGTDAVADNDSVEIRVFALEMVYVPTGSFQLGSGGTESSHFRDGAVDAPFTIQSSGVINVGVAAGSLSTIGAGTNSGNIPAAYPKGYDAFWAMKYEVTQQQYADFLNHLDADRAALLNTNTFTGVHPALTPGAPEQAQGSLSPTYISSIADWSGLRPISEMEFEKLGRGSNIAPVPNEYAWGNTTIVAGSGYTNTGMANEVSANGNAVFSQPGAHRAGIFATATSNRVQAGAGYYGAMELSGNVSEIVFTPAYTGVARSIDAAVHGNGYLDAAGKTDIAAWTAAPNIYGLKGGSYNNASTLLRLSDRSQIDVFAAQSLGYVLPNSGGRLVRTAPNATL